MPRTQAGIGRSLASLYDTVGQRFGADAVINDHEISLIHDLGAAAIAEGMVVKLHTFQTAALTANDLFDVLDQTLPLDARILLWNVHIGATGIILNAMLSVGITQTVAQGTCEIPFFHWTSATGTERTGRFQAQGNLGAGIHLIPDAAGAAYMPIRPFNFRRNSPLGRVPGTPDGQGQGYLAFRGQATAAAAGTVARAYVLTLELPSFGLTVPSW